MNVTFDDLYARALKLLRWGETLRLEGSASGCAAQIVSHGDGGYVRWSVYAPDPAQALAALLAKVAGSVV